MLPSPSDQGVYEDRSAAHGARVLDEEDAGVLLLHLLTVLTVLYCSLSTPTPASASLCCR